MYCSKCGKKISDSVEYCPHCGAKIGAKNDKPVAAYVVKNPSESYSKAQRLIRNTLALGIIGCVAFAWDVALFIFLIAAPKEADQAFTLLSALFIEGCGVASLVLTIIIWCRWRAIKEKTKVSHLWATIGYSVDMGVNLILNISASTVILYNGPAEAAVGLMIASSCVEIFNIFISFYLHHKIKTTIHK